MQKESSFKKIISYAGKDKGKIYVSALLSAISALAALVPYYYLWQIIHGIIFSDPATDLKGYGWTAFLWVVIAAALSIFSLFLSHQASVLVSANIRKKLIAHVAELPYEEFQSLGTGRLRKTITESAETIERYVAYQFPEQICTLVTPVGVLVMIFAFDLRLGLFSIISLVLGIIILVCFMGKGLVKVMKDYQDALEQMSGDVGEYVRDIPVVKIFGQSILSFRKLKGSIDHYEAMVTAYIKRMELPMVAYSVAIYSTFVFLTIGGVMISDGGVNASNLSNYIFYVVFTPAIVLMMNRFMYQSKSGIYVKDAFTRIDSLLSIKPEADILASHTASSPSLVSDCPETFDISLEDVSFCYGQDHNKAVDHISLQVREGSCAVFVGSSGSGKTTLANLIAGLYPVQEGEIRIGGVDVNRISREQLTRLVACVYQDSHLIKGSILDNIRLSHPGASQEEVLEALKNAQCMDIIEKFPEGIHTRIGTKGVHLSGGEVQRLAIARALLKNAPIVILDEATAYADPDNEQKIREALHTLTEGKTVILIAHRLSTLGRGEEIYVFSEGKILEQGTGEVLMQQKGLYYEMCRQYLQSSSWHIKNSKAKERDLQQKAHPEGAVS